MARRTATDRDGFPAIDDLDDFPQLRDGFGRTMVSVNPRIEGASKVVLSYADYRDPSLETFRRSILHWSNFRSVYEKVAAEKRRNPARTAPELLAGLMLDKMKVVYQPQVPLGGGKLTLGGLVADLFIPAQSQVINLHGRYYHTEHEAKTDFLGIIGQSVNGQRVDRYNYIYDDDLYRYEDGLALTYALAGIQL